MCPSLNGGMGSNPIFSTKKNILGCILGVRSLHWRQEAESSTLSTLTTRVRNSVVEAHSDEMVVDGSNPSVPTNVAHKLWLLSSNYLYFEPNNKVKWAQIDFVTQLVEYQAFNLGVEGSSPSGVTKKNV